nr:histidine kinase [Bifidobacterium leontopitheci]
MGVMERITAWNKTHTLLADILMAAVAAFLVIGMFGSGTTNPGLLAYFDGGPMVLWSLLLMVTIALRRTRPQAAALAFVAITVIQLVLGPTVVYADLLTPFMLYSVIVYGDPRNSKPFMILAFAIGALTAMVLAWTSSVGPLGNTDLQISAVSSCYSVNQYGMTGSCALVMAGSAVAIFILIALCLTSAIIVAFWQRARRATVRMMQERNDALRAQELEEQRIAALAERARIARDMHDVVAHTLSIIIVQSDGGRYAGAHDPALARHTMETIRHESERALHDMKRLLGVFGGSDHADWGDIDALIDQARSAAGDGCRILRTVTGTPAPSALGHQASCAMYRMVQEALTNVRKYAGPNVTVTIAETWDGHGLAVSVTDDGRGASSSLDGHKPGYGLIGMRERIEDVGGHVQSGPLIGGGFGVNASVPYDTELQTADARDAGLQPDDGTAHAAVSSAAAATTAPATTVPATVPSAPVAVPTATHDVESASSIHVRQHQADVKKNAAEQMAAVHSPAGRLYERVSRQPAAAGTHRHPRLSAARPSDAKASVAERTGSVTHTDVTATGTDVTATGRAADPRQPSRHIPEPPSTARLLARAKRLYATLRSKPISQAAANATGQANWIERLSQWMERHYLLSDLIAMLLLTFLLTNIGNAPMLYLDGLQMYGMSDRLFTMLSLLPCVFRRRFPESSALASFVFATFQLLLVPSVLAVNVIASMLSLYSAVLYGRDRAWRWTGLAALAGSLLFGFKTFVAEHGYETILQFLLSAPMGGSLTDATGHGGRGFNTAFMFTTVSLLLCVGMMALARWSRSSGTNVLVLQAREDALRAEQAKQRVLAANMERDRISANIQAEVTETLTGVIDKAVSGLTALDECERRGEEPSAQAITDAFAAIGSQGRTALAHMRKLLGVLRETGFSDEAHADAQPDMQLRPAASLDEQLSGRLEGHAGR